MKTRAFHRFYMKKFSFFEERRCFNGEEKFDKAVDAFVDPDDALDNAFDKVAQGLTDKRQDLSVNVESPSTKLSLEQRVSRIEREFYLLKQEKNLRKQQLEARRLKDPKKYAQAEQKAYSWWEKFLGKPRSDKIRAAYPLFQEWPEIEAIIENNESDWVKFNSETFTFESHDPMDEMEDENAEEATDELHNALVWLWDNNPHYVMGAHDVPVDQSSMQTSSPSNKQKIPSPQQKPHYPPVKKTQPPSASHVSGGADVSPPEPREDSQQAPSAYTAPSQPSSPVDQSTPTAPQEFGEIDIPSLDKPAQDFEKIDSSELLKNPIGVMQKIDDFTNLGEVDTELILPILKIGLQEDEDSILDALNKDDSGIREERTKGHLKVLNDNGVSILFGNTPPRIEMIMPWKGSEGVRAELGSEFFAEVKDGNEESVKKSIAKAVTDKSFFSKEQKKPQEIIIGENGERILRYENYDFVIYPVDGGKVKMEMVEKYAGPSEKERKKGQSNEESETKKGDINALHQDFKAIETTAPTEKIKEFGEKLNTLTQEELDSEKGKTMVAWVKKYVTGYVPSPRKESEKNDEETGASKETLSQEDRNKKAQEILQELVNSTSEVDGDIGPLSKISLEDVLDYEGEKIPYLDGNSWKETVLIPENKTIDIFLTLNKKNISESGLEILEKVAQFERNTEAQKLLNKLVSPSPSLDVDGKIVVAGKNKESNTQKALKKFATSNDGKTIAGITINKNNISVFLTEDGNNISSQGLKILEGKL